MNLKKVINLFEEFGQIEILNKLKEVSNEEQDIFIKQINELEKAYRRGIKEYIKKAKILLANSQLKKNSFDEYKLEIPYDIPHIKVWSNEFYELENLGFNELKKSVFVLVAGGLGERLDYKDIKNGLQTDLITLRAYIQIYIETILSYEDRVRKKEKVSNDWFIPFCIMTSEDTHEQTISLLK